MNTVNDLAMARARALLLPAMLAIAVASPSPPAPGATVTYTNPACSSFTVSGTPPTQTVTCVTSGGGATPACAPTASPASPAVGANTKISANCTNQPTSYVWTGNGCATEITSACTVSRGRQGSITFSVQASNPSGQGSPAQITVTWQ